MLARLVETLIYVLALYGFISIIGSFMDYMMRSSRYRKQKYNLVLSVKNQEDNIEGVIRSIFENELFKRAEPECKVIVIDKGSTDDTVRILEMLSYEYDNLEIITEEENL